MNKFYQRIWSKVKERWIIVSQNVIYHGDYTAIFGAITLAAFLSFSGTSSALEPGALPTGGKITSGKGSISTAGSQMTVTQSTDKMIANWNTFNIGKRAGVTFKQPDADSAALNRIYDQKSSQILGTLSANGKIYLINPSGIIFGEDSQVNVSGLVASTLNIADSDFLVGRYTFLNTGNAGSILNQGKISVIPGGIVALIAPSVTNEGTITANGGSVILGAGNQITLDFTGDGLISYKVDKGAIDALAENKGLIQADGGLVVMTAEAANDLTNAVVNNSGIIEAQTLENKGGRIILMSDMDSGTTTVGGKMDASAPNGGNGGFIETSGKDIKINDSAVVTTAAPIGNNGTWLIDPYNFTIAASGGDVTGAALTTALASNSVTIQTLSGSVSCTGVTCGTGNPSGNGDIFVNDNITWSQNTLTLNAYRNIEINSELFGSGTAKLSLLYGQGAVASGNSAIYKINAPVNLPAGNNFSTKLGSDGTTINYYVIISLGAAADATSGTNQTLQGMARTGNLFGYYALGSNIDAMATSTWNAGLGFSPIGNSSTQFTGKFDGLGHTISNLTINRPSQNYVALFGYAGSGNTIKYVGLIGGSISGNNFVGGLVGYNRDTVTNSYVTGSVSGANRVGGLVGYNDSTSAVSNAYATGSVSGTGYVGGLVGYNGSTSIVSNAYATGSVSGTDQYIGGLVGYNDSASAVSNAYATGSVSGASYVGGLVGRNNSFSTITDSYATGSVSGNGQYIGGLVGNNGSDCTISNAYATGSVSGASCVGGLVGINILNGTVSNAYATGSVSGSNEVGGLVAINHGTVTNAHYNIDTVLINGTHHVTLCGLYGDQYTDWITNGKNLNITDYSSSLLLNGGYYEINTAQGLKDLLGFADVSGYINSV